MKNLTEVLDDIIVVMEAHGIPKPAVAIAFTAANEDYLECHWMTNVTRTEGITLFKETAEKMIARTN